MIAQTVEWDGEGRWVEPFMGSGVVAFSLAPSRALLCDVNPHLVRFYRAVQSGEIDGVVVREFLEEEGARLRKRGERHYYDIRERFNAEHEPLDFLFLSRACFNGMMRFNKSGGYNVPFCRKPERFRPAYVTRIVNQVEAIRQVLSGRDWEFTVQDWRETFSEVQPGDFVYLDPPYVGRHTNYFADWNEEEAEALAGATHELPSQYGLSMWLENKHRRNEHLDEHWTHCEWHSVDHFYHVGASTKNRSAMTEVLALSRT
jgi:DNA adenine methylase